MEIVAQIIQICVIPILGILTKYLIDYISTQRDALKAKTHSELGEKYLDMVYQTITDCVMATNQTYVDSLKAQGSFDENAQKEAFQKTLSAVMAILSEDAKQYIQELTGDLQTFLISLIEAQVHAQKQ